jgi:hypothetical protein
LYLEPPKPPRPERLWRVRKDHRSIDAELRFHPEEFGVEVRFYYHGELVYSRLRPAREQAVAEADAKLEELSRAGWSTHW